MRARAEIVDAIEAVVTPLDDMTHERVKRELLGSLNAPVPVAKRRWPYAVIAAAVVASAAAIAIAVATPEQAVAISLDRVDVIAPNAGETVPVDVGDGTKILAIGPAAVERRRIGERVIVVVHSGEVIAKRDSSGKASVEIVGGDSRTKLGAGYFGIRVEGQRVVVASSKDGADVARQVPAIAVFYEAPLSPPPAPAPKSSRAIERKSAGSAEPEVTKPPASAARLYERAEATLRAGEHAAAEAAFLDIVRLHPNSLESEAARYEAAVLAHRRGDTHRARALLEAVIARGRDRAIVVPARRLLERL